MTPRRAAAIAAIGSRRIERRRAAVREPEAPQTLAFALLRCDVERLMKEAEHWKALVDRYILELAHEKQDAAGLRLIVRDQTAMLELADVCRHAGKCQRAGRIA